MLRLRSLLRLACGLFFVGLYASPSDAASPSEAPPRDATQTIFIDLTKERAVQPPLVLSGAGPDPSITTFIDLTDGDLPASMPQHTFRASRTPRVHHIDLSNGASPPSLDEMARDDTTVAPEGIVIAADRDNDPYEDTNRGRFKTHVALHRHLIDPVERIYIHIVPEPLRSGLHNFLTNLETPVVLINDVLQGDVDRAANTISRFVVNSSVGFAGVFDIATDAGIPYRDDDFGQTLAAYGVGDYPYLLVPVIGPSNPRDLTGKVIDLFLNPLHYVALPGGIITSVGHSGAHELDKRSVDVGELDELARSAPDAYAVERKTARERRNAEIAGQPAPP